VTIIYWILGGVVAIFLLSVLRGAPYVPTRKKDIERLFDEVYRLQAQDVLIDIGSGDGSVCIAAARHGARAIGYEINPVLVLIGRWRARQLGSARFVLADFWRQDLPRDTTIVYTFGDGRDIQKMAEYVQKQATRLKKPLYFVSYAFELSDLPLVTRNNVHFLYEIKPALHIKKT